MTWEPDESSGPYNSLISVGNYATLLWNLIQETFSPHYRRDKGNYDGFLWLGWWRDGGQVPQRGGTWVIQAEWIQQKPQNWIRQTLETLIMTTTHEMEGRHVSDYRESKS